MKKRVLLKEAQDKITTSCYTKHVEVKTIVLIYQSKKSRKTMPVLGQNQPATQ